MDALSVNPSMNRAQCARFAPPCKEEPTSEPMPPPGAEIQSYSTFKKDATCGFHVTGRSGPIYIFRYLRFDSMGEVENFKKKRQPHSSMSNQLILEVPVTDTEYETLKKRAERLGFESVEKYIVSESIRS